MSREVRRVPMDWRHPMHWREQWDPAKGRTRTMLVPRPLLDDYNGALRSWESDGAELARRDGFGWTFWSERCLRDGKPYDEWPDHEPVTVRDADHLHELLTAYHERQRPDRDDYMPDFPEGTATGWCMYETTSEGTPISPVFDTPEALARWLADTGASAFGGRTATYEQWLSTIRQGWAPSAVTIGGALLSGVEFEGGAS